MKSWIKVGLFFSALMFLFINFRGIFLVFFDFLDFIIYGSLFQGFNFWIGSLFLIIFSFLLGAFLGWIFDFYRK